jgi:hypothetical protein
MEKKMDVTTTLNLRDMRVKWGILGAQIEAVVK